MHRNLNLKVERIGDLPNEPSILMGNHPSYLDIFLCYDRRPTAIVAAREFKWFPFVGWAAHPTKGNHLNSLAATIAVGLRS